MSNKNKKSKQILSDPQIQGSLCVRVAVYWLASQLLTLAVVSGVFYLESGSFNDSFRFFVPALIAGVIALPLALSDVLSLSNRFAGPLLNFRRNFRQLAAGEQADKLKFRPNDFLQDLSEDYNRLHERLENQSNADNELQEVCN